MNISVGSDPLWSDKVDLAVAELVGDRAHAEIRKLDSAVAIPQIDLCRIRCVRHRLLFGRMKNTDLATGAGGQRWKFFNPTPDAILEYADTTLPQEKFTTLLKDKLRQLRILQRYEARAISMRKFALRALDQAMGKK